MRTIHKLALGGAGALALATALAARFEGLRTHAYVDVGGTPTLCYGHAHGVTPGETATPAQCRAWLAQDMQAARDGVLSCIHRPMSDPQWAAFSDFAYNEGVARFCRSSIARKFNAGDTRGACDALLLYDRAGNRVMPGLLKRRQAERELCLQQ